MNLNINKCPVCFSLENQKYSQDKYRSYFKCSTCELVFVPRNEILSSDQEKNRYDQHDNRNEGEYLNYLSGIALSILPYIKKNYRGLDFGCGITTALEEVFNKNGILMDSFDLYYHPNQEVWSRHYDFIILSEVIEHLHDPLETMEKLIKLLDLNGKIFIKTKFRNEGIEFSNWYYKRDLTHIQFFNQKSMKILCKKFGFKMTDLGSDIYLWDERS